MEYINRAFICSYLPILLIFLNFADCNAQDNTAHATLAPDSSDYNPANRPGLFKRIISYFGSANKTKLSKKPDFSFIGGPHYSSDTKFGIGLLAAGLYSTNPEDSTLQPSNVSIFADITTGGFLKIGISGLHLYGHGKRRVDYELSFNSYSTYFWGVGYDAAWDDNNKSKYLLLDVRLSGDHLWKIYNDTYAGPLFNIDFISANKRHNQDLWSKYSHSFPALGIGGKIQYDTRDNYTATRNGWFFELIQLLYLKPLGNGSRHFGSTELSINRYDIAWKDGVIANRLHFCLSYGKIPWGMMPTMGGNSTMRGYYKGQYRDKNEFDYTLELRQRIWRRSGVVIWGGLGAVFPSFYHFKGDYILPSYGIGYRWEFKKLTNIRLDLGFGKKCSGVEFNINEAF